MVEVSAGVVVFAPEEGAPDAAVKAGRALIDKLAAGASDGA